MDAAYSAELRAVLRLTLISRDNARKFISPPDKPRQFPILRDLVEGVLFSRTFLPTYIIVLLVAVLAWAVVKPITKFASSRKSRGRLQARCFIPSVASSSSSTLQGTESPPLKDNRPTEASPLLGEGQVHSPRGLTVSKRAWHNVRAFLLRQPKPIPALTSTKNTLPANETTIVILLFLALNLFYMFYRTPLTLRMIFVLGDRAGILFVVNLPVLYILAAKNNQPLQWITGWSYEGLNIFHRRLGEWITVAALLHVVGMVVGFYQLIAPLGYTLGWYLTRKIIIFGCIAFVMYLGIYFTSIGCFRQAWYELFLALHISLQVGALVLLFFHHHDTRPYVGAAILIWGLDRLVSRLLCKARSSTATLTVAADRETVLLYCDVSIQKSLWSRVGMNAGWYAGQHVFITVPEMGIKHRFQAHPFTIASPAPPRHLKGSTWPLQLTIRAQDGFSRDLLEYAKFHQHTTIYMDGPYSSSEVLEAVQTSDRVCLVAGGSGIAVTYPFAWARQVESADIKDILHDRPLYINGRKVLPHIKKSTASLDESGFAHYWVRQATSHEGWVTMLPKSTRQELGPGGYEYAVDLITHRFDTRSTIGGERPSIKAELEAWVRGDLKKKIDVQDSICIVVSGPDGLVRDVRNAVARLVREGWNVDVHVEKFGW